MDTVSASLTKHAERSSETVAAAQSTFRKSPNAKINNKISVEFDRKKSKLKKGLSSQR
jgi:hypothetical protein